MPSNIRLHSNKDLLAFKRHVGSVDKGMRRKLNKGLREAVKPTLQHARSAVMRFPSHGTHHTGLRRAVANSLAITAAGGRVAIQIRHSKLPEGKENLPNRMEGIGGPWRHPVFGDRETWVTQPSYPWFYPTMRADRPQVEKSINEVIDAIAKELENF
jgi:hypothetical protein